MSDVLSPSKRPKLHKICVVGSYNGHSDIIDTLKDKYNCEIFLSNDGMDYVNDPEMVFFCSDFDSPVFQNLQKQGSAEVGQSSTGVKILGPAIIRSRITREQEIRVPRSNRPLYCESMRDAVILLGSDVVDKRLFVNMLHYMGAKVRNDASTKINIMLTQRAVGPLIKLSANINAHILLPDYVHYCWANRDNLNFSAMDSKTLAKFALGTFEGLNIAFLGFNPEQYEDMREKVVSNKGRVVTSTADASHVVCNPTNRSDWENTVPYTRQWLVTDEWIWMSVHAGRCLGEESYVVTVANKADKLRKSIGSPMRPGVQSSDSRTSLLDFDHSTHSVLNGSADNMENVKSPAVDKRRMVCHEMFETEQSYLNALQVMLKFRDVIDNERVDDQPLLSKTDSQLIFGRLGPIVEVHQDICNKIKTLLDNWKPNNDVARIWIDMFSLLQAAYVPYLNNYDIAKSALEKALQNQRFYCFVKAKECSPEFKRNQLKELMIRPVQRLPSVILLLKELQKRTDKTDRLHKRLDEAIHVVGNVLSKANTMRAVADEQMALYHKFTDVEDLPSHLMCNRRTFVCEVDGVIIGGTEKWQKLENKLVRLMLFNDVIIVVKIRNIELTGAGLSTPNNNSTLHRMTRQTSLSTLFRQPTKPYKYLLSVPTNYIRFIREVHHQSTTQGPCDEFTVLGDPPLYAFNIREAKGDDVFLLQPKENETMKKLLAHVSAQLAMDLNRDIRGLPIGVDQLTETYVELHECLTKFVRKFAAGNTFLNATINNGTINRPSGFRRAISNAGLTVANRLSKMTASRVNLRNINENSEFSPEVTNSPQANLTLKYDTDAGTPRRGIRNRLTSTLFRRDSIRQPSFDKENKENARVSNI